MHPIPVALVLFFTLDRAALPEGAAALPHHGFVASLAFTPDGKTLISASGDGLVRLWDTSTHKERHLLQGHKGAALSLSLNRDGRTLASGGQDGTVRLWDLRDGKELRRLEGHRGDVTGVAFSPDGAELASADTGNAGEYFAIRERLVES
jgi:WD40 repeat protein